MEFAQSSDGMGMANVDDADERNSSSRVSSSSSSSGESSSDDSDKSGWSNLSAFSNDEGVIAFRSALEAEIAGGVSVEHAVCELFGHDKSHPTIAPIMAALRAHNELHHDLDALASLCNSVYSLLENADNRMFGQSSSSLQRERFKQDPSDSSYSPSQNMPVGNPVQYVADTIARAHDIVVLVGAGVSVSCGIPDFRSEGGLYDLVSREPNFNLGDAQVVFDLSEFLSTPETFFKIAKHLMPSRSTMPSTTHKFLATLQSQKKLRRVYSQNIDGLERKAGVLKDKLVLCHGSFLTATCTHGSCKATVPASCIENDVRRSAIPYCEQCLSRRQSELKKKPRQQQGCRRTTRKNIRDEWVSDSDDDMNNERDSIGVMKPDIVFFGESLPARLKRCIELDVPQTDLVLVFGTSLKVKPVSLIPDMFHPSVPQVLINLEPVSRSFHTELLGDCDTVVTSLCRHLGWSIASPSTSSLTNLPS